MLSQLSSRYRSLPDSPGVYLLKDKEGKVLYVGKAKSLKNRVSSYFTNKSQLLPKTKILVSRVFSVGYVEVESELESLLLEANLIKKFSPKFNSRLTDGKAYPLIRITLGDKHPKILLSRRQDDPKSLYFGPYPSSSTVRMVLRLLRRIIPFQSVANHEKRFCLYHHLGLCPCPPMFITKEETRKYRRDIRRVVKFLNGKTKEVKKDLEKERDLFVKNEKFEEASFVQKRIDAIDFVTSPHIRPLEYEVNPNLREDLRSEEINSLREILNENGYNLGNLSRIECFDISNFQGREATGSMVVLINGEIDKNHYRRFKIRFSGQKPNDYLMMQEIIKRRFRHPEWGEPDLLVVDGGKGQVSAVLEVLKRDELNYSVLGLAKREETLVTQYLIELSLPRDSKALQLVQRIRDEAHRFAITYHKKLRSKLFISK